MRITHNKNKSTTRYQLSGTELRNVSNYKDLRVNMASDLTWTKHVEETVHKANKVLNLLKPTAGSKNKRTLFQFCIRPSFDRTWNTLARYGHHIQPKTSMKLRRSKRVSRIALGQRRQEMAYKDRCKILKWNSLERRGEFLSLVECYKVVLNLNGLNFREYFELCRSTKTRSNYQYKIQTKLAKLICYKYSFFVLVIKFWNDLPSNVVNCHDSPNINKFKLRLKNHMNIY